MTLDTTKTNALRFLRTRPDKGYSAPLAVITGKLVDAKTSEGDIRRAMESLEREGVVSSIRRSGRGRPDRAVVYRIGGEA